MDGLDIALLGLFQFVQLRDAIEGDKEENQVQLYYNLGGTMEQMKKLQRVFSGYFILKS